MKEQSMHEKHLAKPGHKVALREIDPAETGPYEHKRDMKEPLEACRKELIRLQELLYAEAKHSVLIVFQATDTGGKDGTIRHVMGGVNPQGCQVIPFKVPTPEELAHDYLWRIHKAIPPKRMIGIFNRSHYEDVLIVRVHNLVPEAVWSRRYDQINRFEDILAENHVVIRKFFLHISKDEQRKRLEARVGDKTKSWKVNPADFHERKRWAEYMKAYEEALTRCSTDRAPWFVVPANHKWFRNLAVSSILVETLETMDPRLPKAIRPRAPRE